MITNYRWQKVSMEPAFSVICIDCGSRINPNETKIADLNGPAYKAFYHEKCALSLNNFNPLEFSSIGQAN